MTTIGRGPNSASSAFPAAPPVGNRLPSEGVCGRDEGWSTGGSPTRRPNNQGATQEQSTKQLPQKQSPSLQQRQCPPPGGEQRASLVGSTPGGSCPNGVMTSLPPGPCSGQGSEMGSKGVNSTPETGTLMVPFTREAHPGESVPPSISARLDAPTAPKDEISRLNQWEANPHQGQQDLRTGPHNHKNSRKSDLNSNSNANTRLPNDSGFSNMSTTGTEQEQHDPHRPDERANLDLRPSQTYLSPTQEEKDKEDSLPLENTKALEDTKEEDLYYGWGSFRPQCLQFLNKPVWVVVFLCMAIVAESMATVGLVSITISTLEKRFQLSSNQAGLIPSAYECAGLPALIISGYFGGNGHRPRWIAFGMLLLSLGSLLFALPHFLTGPYMVDQGVLALGTDNTCHLNQSSPMYDTCGAHHVEEDLSHYLYVFMAGHTLHGIGGVPLYTLSLTYIDDIATRGTASVYIGVILSLTTLGPAIAFVGAGYLLELYTDLDVVDVTEVDLTSSDPRWVGAWWIGFLVTFTLALMTVIPLAGFPRDMPGAAEQRKKRITEVHDTGDDLTAMHPGAGLKAHDFPRAVSVLVRNPTFMFLTLVGAFELFFLAGFGTFEPKYMENMFHVSPATAGVVTGLLGVPGGAAGSILASVLIKRLKMTSTQMLKWMFLLTLVTIFLNVIFLVQCDNMPFAGVNVPYSNSTEVISLIDSCNTECACSEFAYEPVCGSNNMIYFSPCHAGCQILNATGQYENCACIPPAGNIASHATVDPCTSMCNLLPLYSILFFLGIMSAYLTAMFHLLAVMRVVPDSQRSFAVSIDWFLSRLLGGILGPVAFGSMLDMTCVLWERKCDGSGSCLYYENGSMGWYIFYMAMVCLVSCSFCSFMAWWKYKPPSTSIPVSPDLALTVPEVKTISPEMNGVIPSKDKV